MKDMWIRIVQQHQTDYYLITRIVFTPNQKGCIIFYNDSTNSSKCINKDFITEPDMIKNIKKGNVIIEHYIL